MPTHHDAHEEGTDAFIEEPVHEAYSEADPTQKIDKKQWVVSLLFILPQEPDSSIRCGDCNSACVSKTADRISKKVRWKYQKSQQLGHAMLFIETYRKGRPKSFMADFDVRGRQQEQGRGYRDKGAPRLWEVDPKDVDWGAFLPERATWSVNARKVKEMMAQIHWEMENADLNVTLFDILGSNSLFAKKETFYATGHPELWDICAQDQAEFKRLCHVAERRKSFRWRQDWMAWVVFGNNKRGVISMSGLKPGVVIVKSMWYLMGISTLMAHGYALGAEDFYENKTILDQIDDHTQKFVFRADNCFTWARRKLEMLDIHLESNRWKEMIIAFPGIGVSTQRIDETDHDASSHSLDPEDNEVMTHNLSTITIEEIPDDEEVTQSGGSIIEEWKVSDETD